METIRYILEQYSVYPNDVQEITRRLFQVRDGRHIYALKKSRLTEHSIDVWQNILHQAQTMKLPMILPVYQTKNAQLYVVHEESIYYLTPWLSDKELSEEQLIQYTFEALGKLHAETERYVSIDAETIKHHFQAYQEENNRRYYELTQAINQFEQRHFMSPFELQVCTHYHILQKVFAALDHHIRTFIDKIEQDDDWSVSLCHRYLSLAHIRYHERTYFLNWEYAAYDHPVIDLSQLLQSAAQSYNGNLNYLINQFSIYLQHKPLNSTENHLLAIYLLDTLTYISMINQYKTYPERLTMIEWTQQLQRSLRGLNAGLIWSEWLRHDDQTINNFEETES